METLRRVAAGTAIAGIIATAGMAGGITQANAAPAAALEASGSATGTRGITWCGNLASYAVAAAVLSPITAPFVAAAIERDTQTCN